MNEVIKVHNQAGLHVSVVYANQEFEPLLSELKNENLIDDYNLAPAGEHVPQAERNNRTIQERMRSVFHSLPFQAILSIMIKYLAVKYTQKLNYSPPKGCIPPYYSLDTIIHRRRLNYDKHCCIPQFSDVIAQTNLKKTNTPAA
jgi:hypothetical protein